MDAPDNARRPLSMKKKLFGLLKIVVFLLILAFLFRSCTMYHRPAVYDTIYVPYLAEDKNSIDVVVLGNSFAYCAVYPMEMWKTSGITSFVLASPQRPTAATMKWVDVAVMTQSPKVIVFSLGYFWRTGPSPFENNIWNYQAMPFSIPRIEGIIRFTPPGEWPYLLVDLLNFHNMRNTDDRVSIDTFTARMTGRDVKDGRGYEKGSQIMEVTKAVDRTNVNPKVDEESYAYALELIKEMNEHAKKAGAKLLLLSTPNFTTHLNAYVAKLESDLAGDENAVIYNMNTDEEIEALGFDFGVDMIDGGHLNYVGAMKVSKRLAVYLQREFNLPDRRDDADYQKWHEDEVQYDLRVSKLELREAEQ